MRTRKIRKVIRSKPTIEGAGVHLRRAFGFSEAPDLDPFLLLDDFRSVDPRLYLKGFPWHPHRGIETITYVLEGRVEHGDSMGNEGVIAEGDVQWMTAGSGIIHQEMPKGDDEGKMGGFQLWANLPASHKMMDPRYRGLTRSEIPSVTLDGGAAVRVICGTVNGVEGPVKDIVTEPEYLDVTLASHGEFVHSAGPGRTAFAYVIGGEGSFCAEDDARAYEVEGAGYFDMQRSSLIGNHSLVIFNDVSTAGEDTSSTAHDASPAADSIRVTAGEKGVRFLFVSGKPLGEPVAWYGPIVMNTREELETAFEEYRRGTFIKKRGQGAGE